MNWAAHLKHLQAILKEFDSTTTSNKELLIWYFEDGLKPLIHIQLNKKIGN